MRNNIIRSSKPPNIKWKINKKCSSRSWSEIFAQTWKLFDWKSIYQIKIDERLFLPLVEWHTYHWEVDEIEKSVAGRCTKLKCEMKMTTTICTHTHKTLTHTKLAHFFPLNVPPSLLPTRSFSVLFAVMGLWDSYSFSCPVPATNKQIWPFHFPFYSPFHSKFTAPFPAPQK